MRRRGRLFLGLSIVALLAIVFHATLLAALAGVMTVDDDLQPADVVLPLYDGPGAAEAVMRLYRGRVVAQVVVPRRRLDRLETLGVLIPTHDRWRIRLERQGIPSSAVRFVGADLDTDRDIGRAITAEFGGRPTRVIALTAAPASRLSRDRLRLGLAGSRVTLSMHVIRVGVHESNWWKSRDGWVAYFDAYCLWILRGLRRG